VNAFSAASFDRLLEPVAEPVSLRRTFSARASKRGVVIEFRRVGIVVAPWFCAIAALLERGGELHRRLGMDVRSVREAYQLDKDLTLNDNRGWRCRA
jgi:hypothetical protein